jgi:hypothetical protein
VRDLTRALDCVAAEFGAFESGEAIAI